MSQSVDMLLSMEYQRACDEIITLIRKHKQRCDELMRNAARRSDLIMVDRHAADAQLYQELENEIKEMK